MIDLKEAISYCIEFFPKQEAVDRIYQYIQDSLELKEKEIELKNNNLKLLGYKNGEFAYIEKPKD